MRIFNNIFKQKELTSEFVYELISGLFLLFIGLLHMGRGTIWIGTGDEVLESADVYKLVAEYFPIQVWGVFYFIGGLLTFVSALTKGNFAYINLIIGNVLLVICNTVMYMASTVDGVNLYTPFSTGLLLIANIIFIVLGGAMIWMEKTKKSM